MLNTSSSRACALSKPVCNDRLGLYSRSLVAFVDESGVKLVAISFSS